MQFKALIFSLIIISVFKSAAGQNETYMVSLAAFSSPNFDEFSPVYFKNGIVYCINRPSNNLFTYYNSNGKGQFKIFYIDTTGSPTWKNARLFSKSLTSKYNDGPATFSVNGDTIYFSRNRRVEGKMNKNSDERNKLGIFSSVFDGKNWSKPREFRFNNEWYNVTTPCLSPDGKNLFFASDQPGGFGGSDLYMCKWTGEYWDDPVNLGPDVNTSGNEAYPYMNSEGYLFFSSDGLKGLGGKDIYVTRFSGGKWLPPAHLDAPVNSEFDDFGLVTDSLMTRGFFSSNRNKSLDIFSFRTRIPQIFFASRQKENNYCFQFADSGSISVDTLNLRYLWSFGEGQKAIGRTVVHCFKGPGIYPVKLDIIDKGTGIRFFNMLNYNLVLKDFEQPYINSKDVAVIGQSINFDGSSSNLKEYDIIDYTWDFGDGIRAQGENVSHSFTEPGEYRVTMGLTIRSHDRNSIQKTAVSKSIVIFKTEEEGNIYKAGMKGRKPVIPRVERDENAKITGLYSAEAESQKDAVFEIELLNSKTRQQIRGGLFNNLPGNFSVREVFDNKESLFRYVIDEQLTLMQTLLAYRQVIQAGYKSAQVVLVPVEEGAPKELYNLKKVFGTSLDAWFDKNDRLTSEAYLILDQVYKVLNKYPSVKLEISIHEDGSGTPADKLRQSQQYGQIISTYLVRKGLDLNRLSVNAFGSSVPVSSEPGEKGRALNRRVEFAILK